MCYYNGQLVTKAEFIKLKKLEKEIRKYDFLNKPVHVGFSYTPGAVLKPNADKSNFDIVEMEWGFIPPYWKTREEAAKYRNGFKDPQTGKWVQYITLNAMSEELLLPKKMYRNAALKRRCLVLSTGFFEWRHIYPLNKRTGQPIKTATKYPYYIHVKDQEYFFMAGIWQPWTDQQTGEYVETFSLITTEANSLMSQVHNSKMRMPTILNEELAWEWMMEDLTEERINEIARTQFPSKDMEACTIAKEFLASLEPSVPFEYEDVPAIELL